MPTAQKLVTSISGQQPTRHAALPADTPRVEYERVCASLPSSLVRPCFYLERTQHQ